MKKVARPLVGVVMGSTSDWETMRWAYETLERFGVPCEKRVVSAHRTPKLLASYASEAEERGLEVIIAGAGGAAHLPGMLAAQTSVPVLGVPGSINAGLLAVAIVANAHPEFRPRLKGFRAKKTREVVKSRLP